MHGFVAFFFGMVLAWAIKQRNEPEDDLRHLRVLAGGLAAAFPAVQSWLRFFSPDLYVQIQYGVTWSVLLAPLYALGLAFVFGWIWKKKWQTFFPITLAGLLGSILLGLLTANGVRPLAPIFDWHISAYILDTFDFTVLGICILTLVIGYVVKRWPRDIARVGLILVAIYCVALTTFHVKAHNFAERYAQIMKLDAEKVYALPQPVWPMNWRLIVVTKNDRLHDTMVNLFREEEIDVQDDFTRAARIDAMYKPVSKAVWRIYRRFDNLEAETEARLRLAWASQHKSRKFRWRSRFAVFRDFHEYKGAACARFIDLRFEGAKMDELGNFFLCQVGDHFVLRR